MKQDIVKELKTLKWHSIENHEVVGAKVLLLFDNLTIRLGYRKAPSMTKYCPNEYYCVHTDEVLVDPKFWSYP